MRIVRRRHLGVGSANEQRGTKNGTINFLHYWSLGQKVECRFFGPAG
jgi:hypothetical protein